MNKCSFVLFFFFFFILQNQPIAEQSKEIKNQEPPLGFYIELALKNNLTLRQQILSLSQQELILKKAKKQQFYPQIDIELTSSQEKETKWITQDEDKHKEVTIKKEPLGLNISASIGRAHPLGGKLQIALNYSLKEKEHSWEVSLESQEPLSRYSRELLKKPFIDEEEQLKKEQLQLEERINELVFEVVSSYIELQQLNLSILLKTNELKDLKETLEIAKLKFQKGIIPEIDLLEIELESLRIETEIDALKRQREEQINRFCHLCLGEINLAQTQIDKSWLTKEKTQDYYQQKIKSLKTKVDALELFKIIEQCPAVKIKYLEIEEAKRKLNAAKSLNAPVIIPFFKMNIGKDIRSEKIGLSFKVPIYDKGIKAEEIKLASISLAQKEIELKNLLISNKINLKSILDNIYEREKRIEVQEKNLNLAQQIYEIAKIKHARGLISAKDLLEEHRRLFSHQKELIQLQINLYLDYVNLLKLTSQLYNAYQENLL